MREGQSGAALSGARRGSNNACADARVWYLGLQQGVYECILSGKSSLQISPSP